MTIAWGVVIALYLPDGSHNGKMFTEYERTVLVWRVTKNRTGVKHSNFQLYQVKEALLDPKTYLLLLIAACLGMLNGSVSNFGGTLVKGFGFDGLKASLLQALAGIFEMVMCIVFEYLAQVKNMMGATIISEGHHFLLSIIVVY